MKIPRNLEGPVTALAIGFAAFAVLSLIRLMAWLT
jgi:hypothetical protein